MLKLESGMLIDGFRVGAHLHRGGMANLWEVHAESAALPAGLSPNSALIMKVPYLSDHTDPTAIVSFEVEQMILPTLRGPRVPRFVANGDFSRQPYIVMERLPGESLRARFTQAPLPIEEVVQIGIQVTQALHALHLQGVIHLDIKPSNILFRPDGTAVLIDYGLAHHDRLPDLLAEEFRLPLGTGPYIAPEQVLQIRYDPRSDLFATAVLLYHLLTGARPFGYPTTVSGLRQRLWRDPIPPRAIRKDCPAWLQEIILRCLEADPAARYGSAAQLAFALQNPEQVALTARAHKLRPASWWTVWQRRWQRRWSSLLTEKVQAKYNADSSHRQLSRAPIIMLAVDLAQEWQALAVALRIAAERICSSAPDARLACVSVLKIPRIGLDLGMDVGQDGHGQNRHAKKLIELQHWARELSLAPSQITFHVLEAADPASAILDYARTNQVDQIILGARGRGSLRRYLGSVSARVVAQAGCTVTVVKDKDMVPVTKPSN